MAGSIITNECNYQRSLATAQSFVSSGAIPDTSRDNQEQPTIKPVAVSLPYRYIPANAKN
jgi:phycobilisome rod-core linker protein